MKNFASIGHSRVTGWRGNLIISNGEKETMLEIEGSKASIVPVGETGHGIRGGQDIAGLVVGSESPDEVVEMSDIEIGGDAPSRHSWEGSFSDLKRKVIIKISNPLPRHPIDSSLSRGRNRKKLGLPNEKTRHLCQEGNDTLLMPRACWQKCLTG